MRQKIENKLHVTVEGVDLSGATHMELYLRQGFGKFFQYTPAVLSGTELMVTIPYEDAMQLCSTNCELQLAFTDSAGNRVATEPIRLPVEILLKEDGYDPV